MQISRISKGVAIYGYKNKSVTFSVSVTFSGEDSYII